MTGTFPLRCSPGRPITRAPQFPLTRACTFMDDFSPSPSHSPDLSNFAFGREVARRTVGLIRFFDQTTPATRRQQTALSDVDTLGQSACRILLQRLAQRTGADYRCRCRGQEFPGSRPPQSLPVLPSPKWVRFRVQKTRVVGRRAGPRHLLPYPRQGRVRRTLQLSCTRHTHGFLEACT